MLHGGAALGRRSQCPATMKPSTNPYASPEAYNRSIASGSSGNLLVSTLTGIAIVIGWPILFAAVGGSVAAALNKFAPDYYPGVFPHAVRGDNAASVGVGTGIIQGLMLGVLLGIIAAVGLGWFKQLRPLFCAQVTTIIAAVAILFGTAGTLVGYGLGRFVPGYYRGVFADEAGPNPNLNPVDVGIGLGCSEGLLLGAVVGTAVAVFLAWRRSRLTTVAS